MTLFIKRGFEATTVDDIARQVGISRRSLFRYFSSKEEMAQASITERGRLLLEALRARPEAEGAWEALYAAAFSSPELSPNAAKDRLLDVSRVLRDNPTLQGFRLDKQKQWQAMLAPEIARRLPASSDVDAHARAIVATALACLDAAVDLWVERGGEGDVLYLFTAMVEAVRSSPS